MDDLDRREPAKVDTVAESEHDKQRREDLIRQFEGINLASAKAFEVAANRAIDEIKVAEKPKPAPGWIALLDAAISAVMAGSAGAIGQTAGKLFTSKVLSKFVGDAVKDVFTKVLKPKPDGGSSSGDDLRNAFVRRLEAQQISEHTEISRAIPPSAARLRQLSLRELQELNDADLDAIGIELADAIHLQMIVGWTNFVARAVHGAMGPWDPWQRHGGVGITNEGQAIPLRGAAKNRTTSPNRTVSTRRTATSPPGGCTGPSTTISDRWKEYTPAFSRSICGSTER